MTIARLMLLGATLMVLHGCGGGTGATQFDTPGSGVSFSMANFQSLAPDFVRSFALTGTDTTGAAFSGTFATQNLAGGVFNGLPAVPRVQTLGLTDTRTNGFTTAQETLWLGANFQILGWSDNLTGVTCVPAAPLDVLPGAVLVGNNDFLGTLNCSDATRRQYAWRVEEGTDGRALFVLVTTVFDGTGTQRLAMEQGFLLDSAGAFHGVTLVMRDLTVNVTTTLDSTVL